MTDAEAARSGGGREIAGRYELGRVLGRGGAAEVLVARDSRLSRHVAVKLLRDTTEDASARERFVQEARVLAQLSHHGIVTVLDAGFADDQPFLVLELVEGLTLAQVLARGPLPSPEVVDVGAQMAEAVAHAHRAGVVHRDIKPANVILGNGGRVKVVDFGIARLIGDTVRHTRTGMAIGTAAYLSPEQVTGQPVGPPTDVYALGLTLLEALTGERAFPGPSTEAALARLHRPPHVPAAVGPAWGSLLTTMTATDPAARPTAESVATALRTWPEDPAPRVPPRPVDGPGTTRPLTSVGPPPAAPPGASPAVTSGRPRLDRWGDALARVPSRGAAAWSRTGTATRGAAAAVAALVVLLVLVAVLGRGGSTGGGVPDDTPPELRGPLGDLHDAVEG